MRFLIGLDDTDSNRGSSTGILARKLGLTLENADLGRLDSVTRHQLFASPQINSTTHNSAVCITFEADQAKRKEIEMACRSYLLREYSSGSNAGYALAAWVQITVEVFTWAKLVKNQKVSRAEAIHTARSAGIAVAGLCGSGDGVIGALAAIGLRYRGEDGRFLWLPGLDELVGTYTYSN
jgi:tRNA(Ile2) C34 agmatinyltransferase TiaS